MDKMTDLIAYYQTMANEQLKNETLQLMSEADDLRQRQQREAVENDRHWFELQEEIDGLTLRIKAIGRVWFFRNKEPMPYEMNDDQ